MTKSEWKQLKALIKKAAKEGKRLDEMQDLLKDREPVTYPPLLPCIPYTVPFRDRVNWTACPDPDGTAVT